MVREVKGWIQQGTRSKVLKSDMRRAFEMPIIQCEKVNVKETINCNSNLIIVIYKIL